MATIQTASDNNLAKVNAWHAVARVFPWGPNMNRLLSSALLAAAFFLSSAVSSAQTVPTDIQQPGTQPNEIGNLESPDKCDNCHGGYNSSVEPAHNWRGSMMAQAGRDPIFWATLAIAEQDFAGSGDLCIRCHSTGGWLAGRSTPTDGSGLAAGDSDGVECDYCHKLTNPDNSEHHGVMNEPFVANDGNEGYYGSGMSSMWGGSDKLGPYNNAEARHQFMQSEFHRDVDFCGTCHDVSNPAVGDLAHNFGIQPTADSPTTNGVPGGAVDGKAAFNNPPYKYGVVERTFSEYKAGLISQTPVSTYPSLPDDLQGGALEAIYNAATKNGTISADYQNPTATRYYSCQSCHMRPVTGEGANKRGVPVRTDLPLHDMTGGNYWMAEAIEYLDERGKLRLGGGLSSGVLTAMHDGALRAKEQLELAASLSVSGNTVKIVNHTGHKLISGYPEGRRMWLNVKWYDSNGTLLREDGEYGQLSVQIDGQAVLVNTILDLQDENTKIYEAHMGMTQEWANRLLGLGYDSGMPLGFNRLTGDVDYTLGNLAAQADGTAQETFHFVLNNTVIEDNRIPPYGMSYDAARTRNALPVPAGQYGGAPGGTYDYFDEVPLNPPTGAASATISLMYQPTSWEYIQFLYLGNDDSNAFLADEGINMLDAWLNTGMAAPHVMAQAAWGTQPEPCSAETPTLTSATPGNSEVTVAWGPAAGDGYNLYYDQAGKAQLVAGSLNVTSYTDTGLTNEETYCYKATTYNASCESAFSNILCATPTQPGQAEFAGVAEPLATGKWVREGKGKNATTTFVVTDTFVRGDGVVIQAAVTASGTPVSGATVSIAIAGPESVTLTSGPSDASGVATVTWNTQAPNKKGNGGTTAGSYIATTTGVTVSGFVWDQVATSTTFVLNP